MGAFGPSTIGAGISALVGAERRLIDRAGQVILLVDSGKFASGSGTIVCGLEKVDVLVTDAGIAPEHAAMVTAAGVELVVA